MYICMHIYTHRCILFFYLCLCVLQEAYTAHYYEAILILSPVLNQSHQRTAILWCFWLNTGGQILLHHKLLCDTSTVLCSLLHAAHTNTNKIWHYMYLHAVGYWQTQVELAGMIIHFASSSVIVANGQSAFKSLKGHTRKSWPSPHPARGIHSQQLHQLPRHKAFKWPAGHKRYPYTWQSHNGWCIQQSGHYQL